MAATDQSDLPHKSKRLQPALDAVATILVILAAAAVLATAVRFWSLARPVDTSAAALADKNAENFANVPHSPQPLDDAADRR